MYFGVDVLTDNGVLEPVQWSPAPTGQRLQGSLLNKKRVQDRYNDKVRQARADPSAVIRLDGDGMRAIIEMILKAVSATSRPYPLG
jgi:hypothetical protein